MAGETISLGDVQIGTEVAERRLQALERELGRTIDRTKGLGTALTEASVAVREQREALSNLGKAAEEAADKVEEVAQAAQVTFVQLGRTAVNTATLESKLSALEKETGKTADRSQGLARAYVEMTREANRQREAVDRLTASTQSWSQRGSESITRVSRGYNEVAEAVGRVVSTAQGIAQLVVQHDQHERSLRALGSAYSLVRAATNDSVTAERALTVQQRITQSGLRLSGEELATFMRGAREHAIRANTDVGQSIDQLTDAIVQGESGGFRRFGVSMQQGATRAQMFEAALRHFNAEQRRGPPLAQTAAERVESFGRAAREAGTELGLAVAAMARAIPGLASIVDFFSNATTNARGFAQELRTLREGALPGAQRGGVVAWGMGDDAGPTDNSAIASRGLQQLGRDSGADTSGVRINEMSIADRNRYASAVGALVERTRGMVGAAYRQAVDAGMRDIRATFNTIAQQTTTALHASQQAGRPGAPPPRDPLGVGQQSNSQIPELLRDLRNAQRIALINSGRGANFNPERLLSIQPVRGGGESEEDYLRRRIQAYEQYTERRREQLRTAEQHEREAAQAERDRRNTQIRDNKTALEETRRQLAEERMQREFAERQRVQERVRRQQDEAKELDNRRNLGRQMLSQFRNQLQAEQTFAERFSGVVSGWYQTASSALADAIFAWVSGAESFEQAMGKMLKSLLETISKQSLVESLRAVALGIGALATQNYAGAALFFAQAAAWGVAGVATGVAAGALGRAQATPAANNSAASGSSDRASSQPASASSDRGGPMVLNVVVNGALLNEGVAHGVVRALNYAGQLGVRPRDFVYRGDQ